MTKNATNTILMVRPIRFGMNAQTAVDNFYQQPDTADAALDNAKARRVMRLSPASRCRC